MIFRIDVDKYMLRILWVVTFIVSAAILNRYAPNWPSLPFIQFGLTSLATAIGTYLVAFMGTGGFLMAKNRDFDTALVDSDNTERFVHALTEPTLWGNLSLLTTALYFASTHWNYTPLVGAMEVLAISTTFTAALAVLRNLHMIKAFMAATVLKVVHDSEMKDMVMSHMVERIKRKVQEQEAEESGNSKSDVVN